MLTAEEYEEISQDLKEGADKNFSGELICVVAKSYKIHNAAHIQEYDPDLSEMRAYENNLESLVKIEYRSPKCEIARHAGRPTTQRGYPSGTRLQSSRSGTLSLSTMRTIGS